MIRKCFYKPNKTNDDMQPAWEDAYFIEFTHTVNMEDKVISWAIIQHNDKLKRVLMNNISFDSVELTKECNFTDDIASNLSDMAAHLSNIEEYISRT